MNASKCATQIDHITFDRIWNNKNHSQIFSHTQSNKDVHRTNLINRFIVECMTKVSLISQRDLGFSKARIFIDRNVLELINYSEIWTFFGSFSETYFYHSGEMSVILFSNVYSNRFSLLWNCSFKSLKFAHISGKLTFVWISISDIALCFN